MLKIAPVLLLLLGFTCFAQHIVVENGMFRVINYTLIEEILIYRIYDYNTKECIRGGELDAVDFYIPIFFTNRPGKYEIIIYQKPNRIFIKEIVKIEISRE